MISFKKFKLGEVGNIITGNTPSSKNKDAFGFGTAFITPRDIKGEKHLISTERELSENGKVLLSNRVLPEGSLCVTCIGEIGRCAITKNDSISNQQINSIIPDDKIVDVDYLYYYIINIKDKLKKIAGGTTMPILNKTDFSNFEILLPSIKYQRRVGAILSSLDNKIANNKDINQTLEATAQRIFQSWFVDFDPVKYNEKGEQMPGLSPEIQALFPNSFEESELGMVPDGWEKLPIGELLSNTIGGDWGKEVPDEKHTEKVRIIRGTDFPKITKGDKSSIPIRYVDSKKLKSRQLVDGDIIIEVSGGSPTQPTGRIIRVTSDMLDLLGLPSEPASFCRLFRPKNIEISVLLEQHLKNLYDNGGTWKYQNKSTGISNFQTQYFLANEFICHPNYEILNIFYETLKPLLDKISHNASEIDNLSSLRDTLLPKLISGEVTIKDAESSLEL